MLANGTAPVSRLQNDVRPRGISLLGYRFQWAFFRAGLIALDALIVFASLAIAYFIRVSGAMLPYEYEAAALEQTYWGLALLSMPVWVTLLALNGLYKRDNLLGGSAEYQAVFRASANGVVALLGLSFLWRDLDLSRLWLILSWAFLLVFMWAGRMIFRRLGYWLRRHGWLTARVLMVGANDQGIAMATQWQHAEASGMRVVGFVDDFKPVGTTVLDDIQVIGRPTSLLELVKLTGAQEVVVVPNSVAWETLQELVTRSNNSAASGFTLRLSPGYYEFLTTGIAVTNKTFVPLFTINEARIVGMDSIYKVVFDYGLGLFLSVLSLPVSLALVVFLKLTAPRIPVLARYQASGQGGKLFTMLKFNLGPGSTSEHQPPERLKRLRDWLYGRGLDKLPQLLNVLAGQMSVVGPRPRVFDHSQPDSHQAHTLTTVKPGIIGPWTVGELWTTPDELHDEMYYVRNWTIWLDVQIFAQSMLAFLSKRSPVRRVESRDQNKKSRRVVSKVTFEAESLPLYPVGRRGLWQSDSKEDNSPSGNRYAA